MPDLLLFALALLVVVCLVLRWAVRAKQRAHDQHLMNRVYYPARGKKRICRSSDADVERLTDKSQTKSNKETCAVVWRRARSRWQAA